MDKVRSRLSEIVEPEQGRDIPSRVYDIFMIVAICLSLVPLMFKERSAWLNMMETIVSVVFVVDYLLRWVTADKRSNLPWWLAIIVYPLTLMALTDAVSLIPFFYSSANQSIKVVKMMRLLRVLRVLRFFRYYESFRLVVEVVKRESRVLFAVVLLACSYIFVTALVMFNVEGDTCNAEGELVFVSFFDSLYWAACTLTTVGYGDIIPVSAFGRVISMVSAIVGVAIIALPSGIMTAGYMEALRTLREAKEKAKAEEKADEKKG